MYQALDTGVIRSALVPLADPLPSWPGDFTDSARLRRWMGEVWAERRRAEAISHAAPILAQAVRKALDGSAPPSRVERTARSLSRYLLRMKYRATPFGLFAGTTSTRLGQQTHVRWGPEHKAFAGVGAEWLHEVITMLEGNLAVFRRLAVVADPTWTVRGSRITIAYQPGPDGPASTNLLRTRAAEQALALARTPILVRDLVDKIGADHPRAPASTIETMVAELVAHRVLLTNLRPPTTTPDALGHLIAQLDRADVDLPQAAQMRRIDRALRRHDGSRGARPDVQAALRVQAVEAMSALAPATARSLVVNVRPDVEVVLPERVAREAKAALEVMARITPFPHGSPAWSDYRARFLERYSMGTIVPLRDLTDPDVGLGVPAGYRGSVLPRPVLATTPRDEHLLALAQEAALTHRRSVTLTEADVAALSVGEPIQVPAHVELCFTVLGTCERDLDEGRFALSVVGLSLAAGTTVGRFLSMLPPDELNRRAEMYRTLPTLTAGAVRAQVSGPPMKQPVLNVARAPVVVPEVLALGEFNSAATLDLADLGVVADAGRLYLVSLSTGRVIEPSVMNAVELSHGTHPLLRFLCEAHRSHAAVLTPFTWGAAARLPFLPEVRYGRTILTPACWRLRAEDLGSGNDWERSLTTWRHQHGVPLTVSLGDDDQRLRLDLALSAHRTLLRNAVSGHRSVVLHEAPDERAFGWIGHAHEVVLPFAAQQQPKPAPALRHAPVAKRDTGRLPGRSNRAYLKLYGNTARVPELLTTHLPRLLVGGNPAWFVRYADPSPHVRLRLHLLEPDTFGATAQKVAAWAAALREEGVIQRIAWETDLPETGRYGAGATFEAAEAYFEADSNAALAQLLLDSADQRLAVAAVGFVDIGTGLLGSRAKAFRWLTGNLRRAEGEAPPREVQALAVRLAGSDTFAEDLVSTAGNAGFAVAAAWEARREALSRYRVALEESGIEPADVLPSLLHMHHNRFVGINPAAEATCRRTARAAALSWTARPEGDPR
ncbi:lantibiotic dehydratase [Actinacidiphila yeochonensis]|uniref:lantibiotic dehydratase n=1 Tax=Actinacidiphila yeochonensis TaxID=89050 RepID=UPI000AB9CFB5|nr:lantibiotic dehydratase [Actinacidiphila yeochonensis]